MDLKSPTLTVSPTGRAKPGSGLSDTANGERTAAEAFPRRVLVATDASPTSASAELAGLELSSRVGASLLFLSVIDPSRLRLPGGLFHMRVDQVRAKRESALGKKVAGARQLGVAAQFLIWEGEPGASVVEAADAEGADLIIVGSHARGPVGRLLLGSVSSYVVDQARQLVVVIRPGQRLDDALRSDTHRRGAAPIGASHATGRRA
jgi:nucleotide-binding universal stress UspA family protein